MSSVKVRMAEAEEQIGACHAVMLQLRPHLVDLQKFVEQVQRQIEEGYRLAYIEVGGKVCAAAGFRILEFLVWGKVLFIDDLITCSETRKQGYGDKLLTWLIEKAKQEHCDQIHLESGYHRQDAHRFYLKHGFILDAHHLALKFS